MNSTLEVLLNRAIPFEGDKIRLLDQVTQALSGNNPQDINSASQVWKALSDDPNFWLSSDQILMNSQHNHTKFLVLVIMESNIKQKWLSLPMEEREGIKAYIVNLVMKLGGLSQIYKSLESLLSKANSILVQIVKYEWTSTWRNFLPDLCTASKTDINICQNNLVILKMLSYEIFDFSKSQMTLEQIAELKKNMQAELTQVFDLCDSILQSPTRLPDKLTKSCLETLYSFLSWIPIYYIFFSDIIQKIGQFLTSASHREAALRCLVYIASLDVMLAAENPSDVKMKLFQLLQGSLVIFEQMFPVNEDLESVRKRMRMDPNSFEMTCQNITRFLTTIIQQQFSWLVYAGGHTQQVFEEVKKSLYWIIRMMRQPFEQTYKIAVEFMHFFASNVRAISSQPKPLLMTKDLPLTETFMDIFYEVKKIIIMRMARPPEVLVMTDERGYLMDEEVTDKELNAMEVINTENDALYETIRYLLIRLAEVNWQTTRDFIILNIEKPVKEVSSFRLKEIESISWAAGSLSGNIPYHDEKSFLISVIRALLHLCEARKGKDNKAVIASSIMYVVGQYPLFLKSNWNFLKTVIKKLFEFMKEKLRRVMHMACTIFLKIAKGCREQFVRQQGDDPYPFIYDLIRRIPEETCYLTRDAQKLLFFYAVGYMIEAESRQYVKINFIRGTLGQLYEDYKKIMLAVQTSPDILRDEEVQIKILLMLQVAERLAFAIGLPFGGFLIEIRDSLNKLFIYFVAEIQRNVQVYGKHVLNFYKIKRMRNIGRDILRLYNTYINSCDKATPLYINSVIETFVQPLVSLLPSYSQAIPEVKYPYLLNILTSIFEKLGSGLSPGLVSTFLTSIFYSTLAMIAVDFNSYPDIRQAFFYLIKSLIKYNFKQLYGMPYDKFHTIMYCIIWSIKHDLSQFSDLGLDLLCVTLDNLSTNQYIMNFFMTRYYVNLLRDILEVLTDGFHKSGFRMQCHILYGLLRSLNLPSLTCQLGGPNQTENNKEYVFNYLFQMLTSAFQNVSAADTRKKILIWMEELDYKAFRAQVSDYLVMINRYNLLEHQNIQKSG